MAHFGYDKRIIESYPQLAGGVIIARGAANGDTDEALLAKYLAEQAAVKARIGTMPLSELPSLGAWRRAFSAFGVSPTKYRSAAEALLRRLTKKGDIPSINSLVDIGNLISIRYGLPVAIFDTARLALPITVHYAAGSETYAELATGEKMQPEAGEVVFSDQNNMVVARRWCWRQSRTSAAQLTTSEAVITVEAHHEGGRADIEGALEDLQALLREHVGGDNESAVLDAENSFV